MAQDPQTTQELLEWLMSHQISAGDLQNWLSKKIREDLYLDYKHGNVLKKNKPCDLVREYMTGFANSAGGVLIIGIDDKTLSITGAKAPGGGDLAKWASSCMQNVNGYFSPPPRFYTVHHQDGDVLVVATERAPGLIPNVVAGKLVYHFRIHDQTLVAPEYLIADLLMGRREHPSLTIINASFQGGTTTDQHGARHLKFHIQFNLNNEGFTIAENIQLGLIGWQKTPKWIINNHLLSHLEICELTSSILRQSYNLKHENDFTRPLAPFRSDQKTLGEIELLVKHSSDDWYFGIWRAAVYIIAKNMFPIWYQLELKINQDLLNTLTGLPHKWLDRDQAFLGFSRVPLGNRPVICWDIDPSN